MTGAGAGAGAGSWSARDGTGWQGGEEHVLFGVTLLVGLDEQ
ncbi:hypothetical protein [Streptomyces sp. NPDC096013]